MNGNWNWITNPRNFVSFKGNNKQVDHLRFFCLNVKNCRRASNKVRGPKILRLFKRNYLNGFLKNFRGFCQNLDKFYAICNPFLSKPVYLMKISHNLDPESDLNRFILANKIEISGDTSRMQVQSKPLKS